MTCNLESSCTYGVPPGPGGESWRPCTFLVEVGSLVEREMGFCNCTPSNGLEPQTPLTQRAPGTAAPYLLRRTPDLRRRD